MKGIAASLMDVIIFLLLTMVLKVSCYPFGHYGETILNPPQMIIGSRAWEIYNRPHSNVDLQSPFDNEGYFSNCSPCPFVVPECPCDYYNPYPPVRPTTPSTTEPFHLPTWIRIDNETEWYLSAITHDSWHVAEAKAISLGGHLLEIREDSFFLKKMNKRVKKKKTTTTKRRSNDGSRIRGLLGKVLKKYKVPLWFGVNALADQSTWVWSSNGDKVDLKFPFWNVLDSQGECGDIRLLNGVIHGFQVSCDGSSSMTPRGFIVVRKRTKDDSKDSDAQGNESNSTTQPTSTTTPNPSNTYYPPTPVRSTNSTPTISTTTSQRPIVDGNTPGSPPSPV
ncbi:uncharacterized protein [Lepeophtheirus salmonis]|uniref:uncharacterized protein isoform X2 n=1 Tax=Lepeophtheirus salmonis TaxID=72036 RepID=UPI001AE19112|nr:uncharacterized protein LOC121114595 isoform X2 [Lepeophtheirus salmonis]